MDDKNQTMEMPPAAVENQGGAVQVVYEPAMKMDRAIAIFDQTIEFCKKHMTKDIDFGVPFEVAQGGDGDGGNKKTPKPMLYKPGAEKLAIWFGLIPDFVERTEILQGVDRPIISIDVTCTVRDKEGNIRGISMANCNSEEDKYLQQNRWLTESKLPPGLDKSKLESKQKTARDGRKFMLYFVNQAVNPTGLLNTLKKMAQKRAFVGAVLMATGTSSIFQQTDDDDPGEGQHNQQQKPQLQQSKPADNPPMPPEKKPESELTDAEKEAVQKRQAFYADWKDADPSARTKKILDLGAKQNGGSWDPKWGDPAKFTIEKQMSWLMAFATNTGAIPADPTVKR